jgi:prepilin-type N-terminal cleavage/methylation domain-containing protein
MRITTPPRADRRRAGFSLAEVLIALGILGMALAMLPGLFAAAVKQQQTSVSNVLGSLICRNGLSMARVRLRHADTPFGAALAPLAAGKLGAGDRAYPTGQQDGHLGFLLLGRRMDAGRNDYMLAVVSYAKRDPDNGVAAHRLSGCTIGADDDTFTVGSSEGKWLKVGTPVIAPSGRYAYLQGVEDDGTQTTARLSRPIDPNNVVNNPFVVAETDGGGPDKDVTVSPALAVLLTRTAIEP